jgi:hypothetical protein
MAVCKRFSRNPQLYAHYFWQGFCAIFSSLPIILPAQIWNLISFHWIKEEKWVVGRSRVSKQVAKSKIQLLAVSSIYRFNDRAETLVDRLFFLISMLTRKVNIFERIMKFKGFWTNVIKQNNLNQIVPIQNHAGLTNSK